MNIVMSGSTGFVGTHLRKVFGERGWQVSSLVRDDFKLDLNSFLKKVENSDVVINLAGASIATRWTEEYKKAMYDSRIVTTKTIVGALRALGKKPGVFISASAVGIYQAGGPYTEQDRKYADDFLGNLSRDWERAALEAKESGIRTVIFRLGIVLGTGGGALGKMLVPFRMGLGGVIGDGRQPFSWVHIDDLVNAYLRVMEEKSLEGIFNLTAPNPTTNEGLTKALGHALKKPTFMRVPGFVLRLQLGEAAEALLKGQAVFPKRLLDSGFMFRFADIERAIEDLVGAQR